MSSVLLIYFSITVDFLKSEFVLLVLLKCNDNAYAGRRPVLSSPHFGRAWRLNRLGDRNPVNQVSPTGNSVFCFG
jgi:hypothetical protein